MSDVLQEQQPVTLEAGLASLQRILEDEIHQYEATADKLNQKKDILVGGKPQQLSLIDQDLLTLCRKAGQLEKQRIDLMSQLGHPQCTLIEFIASLPPARKAPLSRCRERLLRAIRDVDRLNRDTRELLDLSLHWIRDTVEIIVNAITPEGASYTAQGVKTNAQNPGAAIAPVQSTVIRSA